MKMLIFLLTVIIAVAIGAGANAEITFWIDENGVKHWSNEETPDTGGAEAERQIESKYYEYVPTATERKEIEREKAFWDEIERENQEKKRKRQEAEIQRQKALEELQKAFEEQQRALRERRILRALEDIADRVPPTYTLRRDGYDLILEPE